MKTSLGLFYIQCLPVDSFHPNLTHWTLKFLFHWSKNRPTSTDIGLLSAMGMDSISIPSWVKWLWDRHRGFYQLRLQLAWWWKSDTRLNVWLWQDSEVRERLSFCCICDGEHDAPAEIDRRANPLVAMGNKLFFYWYIPSNVGVQDAKERCEDCKKISCFRHALIFNI